MSTRLIPYRVGRALDADGEYTSVNNWAVTFTIVDGQTSVDCYVVTTEDAIFFLTEHFSWKTLIPAWDDSVIDNDYLAASLLTKWFTFVERKSKLLQDWLETIYFKVNPLSAGNSITVSTRTLTDFGTTDTYNKYNAGNTYTGHHAAISIDETSGFDTDITNESSPDADPLTTSSVVVGETKTSTRQGAADADLDVTFDLESGTASVVGTPAAPANMPTVDNYTGTYDRAAQGDPALTTKQIQSGDVTTLGGNAGNSATATHGATFQDHIEKGTVSHMQSGTDSTSTDKQSYEADIAARMREYMKIDITRWLLDEFAREAFYMA